jgi:threonine/homoserine/homoserine lactone efflux protein
VVLDFIATVVVVSASGALSPGPLTVATATLGAKRGWRAGLLVTLGHAIVELPLVILIGLGLFVALGNVTISSALALAGGCFLLFFGFLTLKDALKLKLPSKAEARGLYENPVLVGLVLSALNPFFIVWWFGVGTPLIYEALSLWGFQGIALMYVSHVWLDFAWLPVVAYLTSFGRLNMKFLRALLLALAIAVIFFGISFLQRGISNLVVMKLA